MKEYLTTNEVAEMLGVSQMTVIRMCDNGTIPFYRIPTGSKNPPRRFGREALAAWAKEHNIPMNGLATKPKETHEDSVPKPKDGPPDAPADGADPGQVQGDNLYDELFG